MWPSLAGVDPKAWDDLAGGCFYSSSGWLAFCARDGSGVVGAVRAELDGGVAAVPMARIRSEPMEYYRWHDVLAERGLPAPRPSGLLVGPRRGYQSHLLASPGLHRDRVAGAVLDRVLGLRTQFCPGEPCVAMYLTTPDVLALRRAGVGSQPVLLEADAWMDVPAGGWAGWLETLPQRRRSRVRREVRRFRDAGLTLSRAALLDCYRVVAPIWAPNQARYGHPADLDTLTTKLRAQAEAMGAAAQVVLCGRAGEDPVGFCLYYQWGDRVFLRAAGFDYARLAAAAEYFNAVYYAHIQTAHETGVRALHAGIKSTEAKALRGARLRPLWLLDLSDDSVLAGHDHAVLRHNARQYDSYAGSSPAVASAMDHDEWLPFCTGTSVSQSAWAGD